MKIKLKKRQNLLSEGETFIKSREKEPSTEEISNSRKRSPSAKRQLILFYKTTFLKMSFTETAKNSIVDVLHFCCRQKIHTHSSIATTNVGWWPLCSRRGRRSLWRKDTTRTSPAFPNAKAALDPNNELLSPGKFNLIEKHMQEMPASHQEDLINSSAAVTKSTTCSRDLIQVLLS